MNSLLRNRRCLTVSALMFVVLAAAAPTQWLYADDNAAVAPTMRRLANAGSFDKLADLVKTEQTKRNDDKLASLLKDIEGYRKHAADHTTTRREAYEKAFKKMSDQMESGNLNDAVFSAIEANTLADDGEAMLKDAKIVELVKRIEAPASAAEKDQDLLEALSFYRGLELLFDDNSLHGKAVKAIERRLRLTRFYAPEELEKMYEIRAKKLKAQKKVDDEKKDDKDKTKKEDDDEPIKVTREPWEQRLKGVQMSMFRQTISRAAHQHIYNPGYKPLLEGALDALAVMADLPALGSAFPKFKEESKVKAFKEGLSAEKAALLAAEGQLNFLQASEIVDKIVTLNEKTVALPEPVLVYEMADGATSQLDDFTSLIWPHDLEQFARNVDGKFYGVGIQISKRDGRLTVVSPLEGTPAHRAGIRANDVIAKVNGDSTADWSLDRAVREITGPEGTTVKVGIERPGEKNIIDFDLKRAEIVIESVKGWDHKAGGGWDYYIDRSSKIGYVRLTQFIPQTKEGLDEAVEQMEKADGLSGLILDLRGNPGGLLSSAIDISNRFVGEGTIVSTVNSANRETRRYEARAENQYKRFPVVVLVNQGSASASEIVSGALQDYQRGLIIGNRSFGKGSVQDLFPIDGKNAALKLTTQYYRLPAGRIIHRKPGDKIWGINPDLEVKMTTTQVADMIKYRQEVDIIRADNEAPADPKAEKATAAKMLEKGIDPQLEAALLVLKTGLVAEHVALAQKGQPAGAGN